MESLLYMIEFILFIGTAIFTVIFFVFWYRPLNNVWPADRVKTARGVLSALPIIASVLILVTLFSWASFDVTDSFFYILLYYSMGMAWIFGSMYAIAYFFDLSWQDDGLYLGNIAALPAIASAFLANTLIYTGANIGDGPGWWCVVVAGGLGFAVWIALGMLLNAAAQVFERITVERNLCCGIRVACYLLASGILLARASAGDWTSFGATLVEFIVGGWPVLPLTLLAIVVERASLRKEAAAESGAAAGTNIALLIGLGYIAFAVISLLLLIPPVNQNPLYSADIRFASLGVLM